MPMVTRKPNVSIEAAELVVSRTDALTPAKLYKLADDGWSICDAWKLQDGSFNLLLTRQPKTLTTFDVHLGTARCPRYCNCVVV